MVTPRVGKPNGDPTPDRFVIQKAPFDETGWEIFDTVNGEGIVLCKYRYDALVIQDVLETATGRPERLHE
jgi:hypothetical protein